ncbi:MAG: GIY-YIG nuclease family protein [Pseudomonadota bacterium]
MQKEATAENIAALPDKVRGIYVLYVKDEKYMNAVYVGITRGKAIGVKSRLRSHLTKKKGGWTHFSFFEVWDNIPKEQVEELEGLFLNIFGKDRNSLGLNVVKANTKLNSIARKGKADWLATSQTSS